MKLEYILKTMIMNTKILCVWIALLTCQIAGAQTKNVTWGDQGNGTYINPILNADYSDPDVIRVGDKYYMVNSDFHYMGMPVLESDDMINWKIISQVYRRLDFPDWDTNGNYGGGSWAPSIRHHDGKFWIYFCTPREGLMMSTATDPHGPWSPLHCVKRIGGWEDPCPIWDDNGQAYLGRSQLGAGPIILHKMSADGRTLEDDGHVIYTGPVAEGTKFHKRDGYYYISIPEGGVGEGWQTILRSKNIYGPYEWKTVLAQGNSPVNGPHQGAWVDTPTGEDWFLHFQDVGAYGRIMHLQPMKWVNDWPVIGIDKDGDGCGEPVLTYKKPNVGKTYPICTPQESDEFDGYTLSPQWQWHANINEKWAYYAGDKSYVRLYSYPVVEDYKNLWDVANLLLQKTPSDNFTATMKLTFSPNQKNKGERTGLVVMGRDYAGLVLENTDKGLVLSQVECDRADKGKPEEVKATVDLSQNTVYLKVRFSCDGKKIKGSEGGHDLIVMCNFSYSLDGKKYESLGVPFQAREGQWIGAKVGMFCTRPAIKTNDGGWADVDWFRITKK